jgi:GNAT superfamily N-acetyltransferase
VNQKGSMETTSIRHITEAERRWLPDFLYLAIHVPDGAAPPAPEVVHTDPTMRCYVEGFGTGRGDVAMCADVDGRVVAMAWSRLLGGDSPGYGYVDDNTPEIAVAVVPEHRGCGLGTTLLNRLFDELAHLGWARVCLSVEKTNPAHHLYERLGFVTVRQDETDLVMVRPLK